MVKGFEVFREQRRFGEKPSETVRRALRR